ncbi:hypothetical protein H4N54_17875 [Limnospira fusiformis KN01]|uniref:hypothetical protein n=1 Tax=Limnospira fusiformis TaxID=54297 RepID=UPI00061B2F59|nr:hypothetical protein [Limnospira fusiformis]QJB27872.1 hypothetical protein HFV01_21440 [Limnospira fusiformis SAG 85.79]ULB44295.1 hypothetical protein H4N54_17875 [Limnospira fusiformis KN01]
MKKLFFWAQSLDNKAPDLIWEDSEELSDQLLRQQVISEIYEVPGRKTTLPSATSEITVRFSDPKFVVEALPTEKDQANRSAPIVIYGELPKELSNEWIESSCTKISDIVSDKLNRTLSKDAVTAIQGWFIEILEAKKKKVEVQQQTISLVTVFFAPLLIGWLLQTKEIQPSLLQMAGLIALNNLLVMSLQTFLINRPRRKNRTI